MNEMGDQSRVCCLDDQLSGQLSFLSAVGQEMRVIKRS